MQNQHTRKLISTRKTSHKYNKDLSHLRWLSLGIWANTKYINSTLWLFACQVRVRQLSSWVLINSNVCWFNDVSHTTNNKITQKRIKREKGTFCTKCHIISVRNCTNLVWHCGCTIQGPGRWRCQSASCSTSRQSPPSRWVYHSCCPTAGPSSLPQSEWWTWRQNWMLWWTTRTATTKYNFFTLSVSCHNIWT